MAFNAGRTNSNDAKMFDNVANRPTFNDLLYGFEKKGGTKTPDAPTLMRCNSDGSMIFLSWDKQYNLTNFKYYEIQVSDDGVDWYSVRFDGDDWKGTLDATTIEYGNNLLHTKIPYDGDNGRTLSYRVRTTTYEDVTSDWSNILSATTGYEEYFYHIYYAGGGLAVVGGATTYYEEWTNHFEYNGDGLVEVSGNAEVEYAYNLEWIGMGEIIISGSAELEIEYSNYDASGYIQTSGTAITDIEYEYASSVSYTNEISFSSEYTVSSDSWYKTFMLNDNHIICIYKNSTNNSGRIKIGTIAEDYSIIYDSEYTFSSTQANNYTLAVLDDNHIVITYRDNDNMEGKSVIGVINPDYSITFGSEYTFDPGNTYYIEVSKIDSTHFIIAHNDSATQYGTCIIGTVDNEYEISYGSEYVFNSDNTDYISIGLISPSKFVVFYDDNSDGIARARVGTIAEDYSITYGPASGIGDFTERNSLIVLDDSHFVSVIAPTGGRGLKTAVGTISNTSITFGPVYGWNDDYDYINDIEAIKIDNKNFVINYSATGTKSTLAKIDASNNVVYDNSFYEYDSSGLYYVSSAFIDNTHFAVASIYGIKIGELKTYSDISTSGSATYLME